jgi:hypothetical protein
MSTYSVQNDNSTIAARDIFSITVPNQQQGAEVPPPPPAEQHQPPTQSSGTRSIGPGH